VRPGEEWIRALGLQPHPEGGYFREIYRSPDRVLRPGLPGRYPGDRALGTSIYFLLLSGDLSRLHRLRSDEIWHFYAGGSIVLHQIGPAGEYAAVTLGRNSAAGQVFQTVVPAGWWFGAEPAPASFALVGCTTAPGFEYEDFELGRRQDLLAFFPARRALIERLTVPEP
jgi:predicted cupin superfamily sugar epimerase